MSLSVNNELIKEKLELIKKGESEKDFIQSRKKKYSHEEQKENPLGAKELKDEPTNKTKTTNKKKDKEIKGNGEKVVSTPQEKESTQEQNQVQKKPDVDIVLNSKTLEDINHKIYNCLSELQVEYLRTKSPRIEMVTDVLKNITTSLGKTLQESNKANNN